MLIIQNDRYSMVFGPAYLDLVSPKLQASKVEGVYSAEPLLFCKTNGRQIHVVRINTYVNVLMFILRELKDIPPFE